MKLLTKTSPDRVEFYTPAELEPYMAAARAAAKETTPLTHPRWLPVLEERLRPLVVHALTMTKHDGFTPGTVSAPTMTERWEYLPHVFGARIPGGGELKRASVRTADEEVAYARYRASEDAKEAFTVEVDELVDAIRGDMTRAYDAYIHIMALDEAQVQWAAREAERAREREIAAKFTDPITGICDPRHGTVKARSVIDQPFYERDWSVIDSSPLTHLMVQQRLAQRILERNPGIAARVDAVVANLLRDAGL